MFKLQAIHKTYNENAVLNNVSLAINQNDVIAVTGQNGTGKTTLINIAAGHIQPDSGVVSIHNEIVGVVAQEIQTAGLVQNAFDENLEQWRVEYALEKVELLPTLLNCPVANLSGGQKTRLAFARILACDPAPTMLMLDEPTNNLDTDGLIWLQDFIANFRGGVLLVSHDRSFINNVATSICELKNGEARTYGGNYDLYKEQKELEYAAELQRYELAQSERKHTQQLLREAQHRAKQGLRKRKATDNDKAQFDWHQDNVQRTFSAQARALKTRLEKIDLVERPETLRTYSASLHGNVPASKLLLRLTNISQIYQTLLFSNMDLEIRGGDRMQVHGANGRGKSTLLKIAAGILEPSSGERTVGAHVSIGYFSQDTDGLNYRATALDNLLCSNASSTKVHRQARSLGLTHADLQKLPYELSRGQQAKLGFAKLLLNSHDLLILDEPTNHLDIATRELVETALQHYQGAILFASHDSYFAEVLQPHKKIVL